MHDDKCVDFLQWSLPRLGLRWEGYRKVRGQVCKRIGRRMVELGIGELDGYRKHIEENPGEWDRLAFMCRITISRFYRDHVVFDRLIGSVLPALALHEDPVLRCWSAGCASGEEAYTLKICWTDEGSSSRKKPVEIVATDIDAHMLERARRGCYQRGTLKELPDELVERAFERDVNNEQLCVRDAYRSGIRWLQQDIRSEIPDGPFDLILCRNMAFMYFDEEGRRHTLDRMLAVLRGGGAIVAGKHDRIPDHPRLDSWFGNEKIFRKTSG